MEDQKIKPKTEFKIRKSNLKTEFKSQISSQVTCFKQLKFLILKLWLSGWASNINDLSFKAQWVENNSKRAFLSNTTNKKSFFYETMSGYLEPWGQGVNIQTSSRNIAHQMTDLLLLFPPPDFQIFRHPWILIKFCNEYSLYGNIGSRVSNIQQLDKFCTKQKCDVSWNEIKMFKRVAGH